MDFDITIDAVYAAAHTGEWGGALEQLACAFDAQSAAFLLNDRRYSASQFVVGAGILADQGVQQAYARDFSLLDPAPQFYAMVRPGEVFTTCQAWAAEERARSAFYNDFYLPLGLADTLGAALFDEGERSATITVQRGGREFDRSDTEAFERLAPHLKRALQVHRCLSESRTRANLTDEVLDRLADGAVVLDDQGRCRLANRLAEIVLARGDGLALGAGGRLEAQQPLCDMRLRRLVQGALAEPAQAGGEIRVPRQGDAAAYRLLVSPTFGAERSPDGRGALVIIRDPDRAPATEATFAKKRGLTEAEGRLLRALMAGERLVDYCRRTGISGNTGKFHMSGLFAKTGAHSQVELVRLVHDDD